MRNKNRILVMDDSRQYLITIKDTLEDLIPDCLVLTAQSGKEGIEIAIKEQPDIILLDINMPEMDGYEVCRKLKADVRTQHILIIILTGIKTDSESRIKALELGAEAFLTKPIDPAELTAQINVMLRIKAAEDILRGEKELLDKKVKERIRELFESESRFNRISLNAKEVIFKINIQKNSYELITENVVNILGYSAREFYANPALGRQIICEDDITRVELLWNKMLKEGIPQQFESRMIHKSGKTVWLHQNNVIVKDDEGVVIAVEGSFSDITERKKGEEKLKESEVKFRSMTEQINEMIFLTDKKGKITYTSPASSKIFGYTPQEMEGQLFMRYLKKTEIPKAMKQFLKTLSSGNPAVNMELLMKHKNGKIFHGELSGRLFKDNKLEGTIGVIRDITERKLAEEENLKLLTAVTQSPSIIAITDLHGNLEYVNPKFTELTGYSFEEAKGENVTILRSYEQSNEIYEELWQEISSGNEWRGEFYNKKKNGELFWESASVSPIIDKKGKTINYIKIAEDITERKKNEDQIKKDLKIKTALIQEIYHRTKNNMAVISAMISIQSRHTENDYVKSTFREINNKIQAMSLVHQKLYEVKDLSNISLNDYIDDLTKLIKASYGIISKKINFKLDMQELKISIDSAIPLGLIINELVSNIFKHAFPNRQEGEILIRLFSDKDKYINLELSDNGIGFPQNFDPRKDGSMGLTSVYSIVEHQLKGEVSVRSENGLKWHLKINSDKKKERV